MASRASLDPLDSALANCFAIVLRVPLTAMGLMLQLPDAVSLARATLSRAHSNLLWALLYNALAVPVAAGALLPSMGISLSPAVAGTPLGSP